MYHQRHIPGNNKPVPTTRVYRVKPGVGFHDENKTEMGVIKTGAGPVTSYLWRGGLGAYCYKRLYEKPVVIKETTGNECLDVWR